MAQGLLLISAAKRVSVACIVAAAVGATLVVIALGSGLVSARDPYISCADPESAQGRAMLDEYKEATVVGSQSSFWPLGTRCSYRPPDSDRVYLDPPDWALTITMVIGMSITAAAILGAAGVGIVAATSHGREPMALDPSPSRHPDSIE
jgi:hypothetical protein